VLRVIVGADIGKYQSRFVYSPVAMFHFPSKLVPYRELRSENKIGRNDMIIEYEGRKYFGGSLAEREMSIPIQYTDESKAHPTTLINLLAGLHRIQDDTFKIVLGSPISQCVQREKKLIQEMVKKDHTITVNGEKKEIQIADVNIGAEGVAGFWSDPIKGEIQGLDFGSTTINYFVIKDKMFIDKDSDTFPYGAENNNMYADPEGLMEGISSQLANKFKKERPTMLVGGKAEAMQEYVEKHYPHAYVVNPIYATAIGLYKIACSIYG
jgi:plasmid segregation protein ParM